MDTLSAAGLESGSIGSLPWISSYDRGGLKRQAEELNNHATNKIQDPSFRMISSPDIPCR